MKHTTDIKTQILRLAIIPVLIASTSFSCKKKTDEPKEGTADITLSVGSQQIVISGPCGWATAGGVHYIGANHASNSTRVFEASFNMENPPSSTTTYTLVDDQFDTDPSHIWMTVTEIQGSSFIEWTSFDGSGTFTLNVDGDKITANLGGITLEPGSSNASPYNANGTLSGSLEFYRD